MLQQDHRGVILGNERLTDRHDRPTNQWTQELIGELHFQIKHKQNEIQKARKRDIL